MSCVSAKTNCLRYASISSTVRKEYVPDFSLVISIDAEYDRKKVIFISFIFNPLLLVKEADPSIELQYLSQTEDDKTFDTCLQKKISIDVKQTILIEELVKQFHDAGLKVNVWIVDKDSELQVAIAAGGGLRDIQFAVRVLTHTAAKSIKRSPHSLDSS